MGKAFQLAEAEVGLTWDAEAALDAERGRDFVSVYLSPTIDDFVHCNADLAILYGPRGEGKTVGSIARILRLSGESPDAWPVRWVVLRDTWVNLTRTIIPTLEEGHRLGWWHAEFTEGKSECMLNRGLAHLYLWGYDHDRDANKFQGFEAGGVVIEEPAPAADLVSGVPASVLALASSSLRQKNVKYPSIQIPMNPPDDDHWTIELADQLEELGLEHVQYKVFRIPAGENRHLPPGYRERMRALLEAAGRQDLVRRLVEGQIGTVRVGEPVTPEFSDDHIAKEPIDIRYGFQTFRFWDFGLNPTCIWAQLTPSGCLNVLGCVVGVNMGVEELIEQHVIPWEAKWKLWKITARRKDSWREAPYAALARSTAKGRNFQVRDIGDPAGYERDQSSSERSARKSLENLLHTTLEKGPVPWPARRDSVKAVLTRMIGGRPLLQIDPEAAPLIQALRGRWRYAKYPTGRVSPEPIKDMASHPGDAFGYGCAVLWPVHELTEQATSANPARRPSREAETHWGR